ncbi:MAG: zinc ribbon domain-containing protein [Acidobacteria bacterium]|nr:zinc ribbon domain-containing protein [Acidobacteriota bacterium]
MPIYEYVCKECEHRFEALVHAGGTAACPNCQSERLERLLSVFAVSTKSSGARMTGPAPCGACGDPRGPGACSMD